MEKQNPPSSTSTLEKARNTKAQNALNLLISNVEFPSLESLKHCLKTQSQLLKFQEERSSKMK
jgi:hypothetical protein